MDINQERLDIPRLAHPLRRLIKQDDAAGLLAPFLKLMPDMAFGMLDQDGQIYAGVGGWDPHVLARAWERARQGQVTHEEGLFMRPLVIHGRLAGALLVWEKRSSASVEIVLPLLEAVGNGFVKLLEQAVEKRDLGGELLDRYREINLLYRAAEKIGSCLDPEWIPRLVLDQIQPVVSSDMALVLISGESEDPDLIMDQIKLIDSAWEGSVGTAKVLREAAESVLERIMRAGEPLIFNPPSIESAISQTPFRPGVVLCVPLKAHERMLGLLLLGRLPGRSEFTAGDGKLVSALAGQAAIALETARLHQEEIKFQRLEEEMSIGRQIQLSFLPESLPEIPGWDFAAFYGSARQVGGDLYDLIYSPDNPQRLNLAIADVTGKGVAAALFMASTRTTLRLMSLEGGTPGQILRKANHFILQERRNAIFMSAFFASLDLISGRLDYANAGHDWPLLREYRTGAVRPLDATGFLLGAFGEIEPDEHHTMIEPGDALVFYTDGVSEAFNPKDELYGTTRLEMLVASHGWQSAEELLRAILADVEEFTSGEPQSDDLTLLVVHRLA